jgi:hypothetical protein
MRPSLRVEKWRYEATRFSETSLNFYESMRLHILAILILVNNQLEAQFFFRICLFQFINTSVNVKTTRTYVITQTKQTNSNKLTNQMQQFYKFITWRFMSLNMFRTLPRPSSGAYNFINSLWFQLGTWWKQRCWSWSGQTTTNNAVTVTLQR